MLPPNSPVPGLLAVFALLVPKEKELALLAVGAPKRPPAPAPPPVVVLMGFAEKPDCPKEKPPAVAVLLAGCPKPLTCPNTGLPKAFPEVDPNPDEGNPVSAGPEEAGGAADWPKTVPVVVLVVRVGVGVAGVTTVVITDVTPMELVSVVTGGGWVKMEPGLSEEGT